jgi:hypothetical protein
LNAILIAFVVDKLTGVFVRKEILFSRVRSESKFKKTGGRLTARLEWPQRATHNQSFSPGPEKISIGS